MISLASPCTREHSSDQGNESVTTYTGDMCDDALQGLKLIQLIPSLIQVNLPWDLLIILSYGLLSAL